MCLFGSKVLIVADSIGLVKPVKFFLCVLFVVLQLIRGSIARQT